MTTREDKQMISIIKNDFKTSKMFSKKIINDKILECREAIYIRNETKSLRILILMKISKYLHMRQIGWFTVLLSLGESNRISD
jgi:hypothetical protein